MKALIIAVVIIVGGVQIGSKAFDAVQASAQQSQTAELIKARQHSL